MLETGIKGTGTVTVNEEKYPKGYRHVIDNDREYLINALMEDLECRR